MKNKRAVFFDLDGTLLPVNLDRMFQAYFARLKESRVLALISGNEEEAFRVFNEAADVMMQNEGSDFNDNVFFAYIASRTGVGKPILEKPFDDFYTTVFEGLGGLLGQKSGLQRQILDTVRGKGYQTVLATMPVFPLPAAVSRLSWVGLGPEDFTYISHYKNSRFLKPHPGYYEEILANLGLTGEDCIMVGNNIKEDMGAARLGFDVFLVTGYEIGAYETGAFPDGDLAALLAWVRALPEAEGMG
jgi:FMN phosphatase YigB (HAD superfamily)